jgi:uncharacterized protein (DUF2336 family)
VVALANDTISVARPLLFESPVLRDPDLVEIIRQRTQDHQLMIAIRKSLSEEVSDALVATENRTVVTTLLENTDARISGETMKYLVEESQRVGAYQKPLVKRSELTPALATRLYGWVSSRLRSEIVRRYPIDPLALSEATAAAVADLVEGHPRHFRSTLDELADRLAADRAGLPRLIVQALRDTHIPLFYALFARYSGLRPGIVRRLLRGPRGEALCIACKAAGIDRATFASIYLLTRKETLTNGRAAPLSDMAEVLAFYDGVATEAAASLLEKWRKAPDGD